MKSVKMNAKMLLAAAAIASFSLTSCEKEDFNVDVPNIDITYPEVNIPGVNEQEGTVYVMLTASDSNGKLLNGVNFDSKPVAAVSGIVKITGKETVELTITASKDGYLTDTKTISVTPMINQLVSLPINFVLSTVDVEDVPVVEGVETPNTGTLKEEIKLPAPEKGFDAGKYTSTVKVPTAAPYLESEQRTALLSAIDALNGPTTRANDADLNVAKDMLRAKVRDFSEKPETKDQTHAFELSSHADNVKVIINSKTSTVAITLTAIVNGKSYSVAGSYTIVTSSVLSTEADGKVIGHGHGHGHGDNPNAGGGAGGR